MHLQRVKLSDITEWPVSYFEQVVQQFAAHCYSSGRTEPAAMLAWERIMFEALKAEYWRRGPQLHLDL